MFAAQLGELLLDWAYNWIRGEGGFFLKGSGGVWQQLLPGRRLVEIPELSLLFLERLETLRRDHGAFFPQLLHIVRTTLRLAEVGGRALHTTLACGWAVEVRTGCLLHR